MTIDVLASMPHYRDHLAPIWAALPDELRGTWWGPYGRRVDRSFTANTSGVLLVAGALDRVKAAPGRPVVLLEHGAGQSYDGDPSGARHASYSGGADWQAAVGFLCPSERVADRWRAAYPGAEAVAVGCPRLDRWHGHRPLRTLRPVVAFTFHWDCALVPETRSAWAHYERAMPAIVAELRGAGWSVVGHSHPRWKSALARRWHELGVPYVASLEEVMETADVLVADNTSALYEFAATGRPVVALNAPWYRRDVEHGLRFWSHVPGVQADDPSMVAAAVRAAAADHPSIREKREAVVAHVYGTLDGHATQRAVDALVRWASR